MKLPVHKELFLKPYRFEPFHGSDYVFEDIESFTSASHWNSTDFPLQKVLGNDDLLMHIIEYGRVVFASRDYPESQGLYDEIWKLPTKNDCISIVAGD